MHNRGELKSEIVDIPAFMAEKVSEELHQQATFIHTVLNTIDTLVTVLDKQGRIVLFNNACEALTGYTYNDVIGKPIWGFILPEEKAGVERVVQEIETSTGQYPVCHVNHLLSREGRKYLIDWSNSVLKDSKSNVQYVVCTGIDITEQEAAKEALVEREEKLRSLFDYAQDAIFLCELTEDGSLSNYCNVNEAGRNKLGYTLEELQNMSPLTIGVLEETTRRDSISTFLQNKEVTFTLSLLAKNGTPIPFEFNAHIIQYNGKSLCLAIGRDITDRIRVEQELRESEERSRLLVELSPDSILLHQDGKIVYANAATARMFGAESIEDILGMELIEFILPEYRDEFRTRTESIYHTGLPSPFMQSKYRRFDDGIIDIEVTGSLSAFQGKPAIQVIVRDITERKKAEQDTLTADKLQSVGNLAGAIAHEFNNLLTVILGNLSVARMYGNKHDKGADVLFEAEQAAQQARELTQRLLTFARGGNPVKQPVNLPKLLFKSCNVIFNEENINCNVNVSGDLFTVEADEGQIAHAISNIVINAVQAMPGGGSVEISAENVSPSRLPLRSLQPGGYVKITIVDEGNGIPEGQLHRIFDPFYSTKPEGSGLGLPTAYSIIKKHGGHLTVESAVGKGAIFTIYLPAAQSKVATEATFLAGSGRVLLMDDEAAVRKTAKEMLRLLGYDVIEAADGQEALNLYREAKQAGQRISLAILDLVVKDGLGGKETMEALREMDRNIRVLVSSGYSNDPVMSDYQLYGFSGCVPKPYSIEQLGQALQQALQVP